jgi:hypothetical protein
MSARFASRTVIWFENSTSTLSNITKHLFENIDEARSGKGIVKRSRSLTKKKENIYLLKPRETVSFVSPRHCC